MRAALSGFILLVASTAWADAAGDAATMKKMQADFAAAWNKHDAKAMASMFADDGDLINPAGQVARSKREVEALFAREQGKEMKGSTFTPTCGEPRMLKPDLALLDCGFEIANATMPDGKSATLKGGYTVLLTGQGGTWKVVAARAMALPPPPPAAAHK